MFFELKWLFVIQKFLITLLIIEDQILPILGHYNQLIMSSNNSDYPQPTKNTTNNNYKPIFTNPINKFYTTYSPTYNSIHNQPPNQHYKPIQPLPSKTAISQSVIFSSSTNPSQSLSSFSKLDSMARLVSTKEDFQSFNFNKINSQNNDKKPLTNRLAATFSSQIVSQKEQTQPKFLGMSKLSSESDIARKRRESVDLDVVYKQGSVNPNLNFLKRMNTNTFEKINTEKKQECQSTNSGSGNELMEPKKFDFLRKRKENNDQSANNNQTENLMPTFQPFKKSEHIWPLSKSPMEQNQMVLGESKLKVDEQSSVNKFEFKMKQQGQVTQTIQFKKKRFVQNNTGMVNIQSIKLKANQENTIFLRNKSNARFTRQVKITDFQLIEKLGKGAFGQVFMAEEKILGFLCVIKKMSKKRIRQAKVEQHILRQIKLQSYLNHKNLTSIYGYFHDAQYIYLILQLLSDGSLQQIKKRKKVPEVQAVQIIRQVAFGLKYMHEESVIHRDLKPQNIFINENHVKIGDFGCSIYHYEKGLRQTIVGCLEYSSPQQLSKEGYTNKIDSWSLGILAYEMLYGKSPFESEIKKIVQNQQSKPELSELSFPPVPLVSEEAKNFILNLLSNNPDSRMEMDEALYHPFLKQKPKN